MWRFVQTAMLCALASLPAAAQDRFEQSPINYSTAPGDNPVLRLQDALKTNPALLTHEDNFGYLRSVLKALDVPESSQVLVFSKTSLQARRIAPSTPRAIYFNDDVYIGAVPDGEVVEISAADPKLGAAFYTVPQNPNDHLAVIRQHDNCLQCHGGSLTGGYPGHAMRSVFTDVYGYPMTAAGSYQTTQNSAFPERWGGWYVTGTHGAQRHMGNSLAEEGPVPYEPRLDREAGANQLTLPRRVDPARYLTPHSDLVALLVLAHQVQAHNLMTQVSFETQYALKDQAVLDELLKTPEGELRESTRRRIESVVSKLVECLLFTREAPLTEVVAGTSTFAADFAVRGPRDPQGRSLREFDLRTRLFKYPLSYLIYSPQFEGLPPVAKDLIYRRLWDALQDTVPGPLPAETRRATREILAATKPGLPDYWR